MTINQSAWNAQSATMGVPGAIYGSPDTAAKFNGTSSCVIIGPEYQPNLPTDSPWATDSLRNLAAGSFSVEAWVKVARAGQPTVGDLARRRRLDQRGLHAGSQARRPVRVHHPAGHGQQPEQHDGGDVGQRQQRPLVLHCRRAGHHRQPARLVHQRAAWTRSRPVSMGRRSAGWPTPCTSAAAAPRRSAPTAR